MDPTPASTRLAGRNAARSRAGAWFASRGWQVFDFQAEVWDAYANGESGLIHSATGSGKTLAAWLAPVLQRMETQSDDTTPPLTVIWLTPMRALAADTAESLRAPIAGMGLAWTVGLRTGDTSTAERAKQNRRMPSALVTTPESLSLMLSQDNAREMLGSVEAVVADEWHELMGSKRGVQAELAIARLKTWNPALRIWGVSATLGNVDEARDVLLAGDPGRMVEGVRDKTLIIDTLIPDGVDRHPWAGHLGAAMMEPVAREVDAVTAAGGTTLIFTNTRSQSELWYQGLLEARPHWAGELALHHGSLAREVRDYVEGGLKSGALKCVVATSSLDLGVDFAPVARVLQVGSPKGVARLLQRAGRSGHSPGRASRITTVPTYALEFIEAAAARRAAHAGRIESRLAPERPLDVLVQHLVTIAAGEGFVEAELLAEVTSTHAYRGLSQAEWDWALDFVSHGGVALKAYPEYHKIALVDGRYRVPDKAIARRHRMAIGTIVSNGAVEIRFMKGARLGYVEEGFIARLSPGDAFTFAGRTLELIRVRDMTAYVKPAQQNRKLVPRWDGSRMSLSSQLAASMRDVLQDFRDGRADDVELKAIERLLTVQQRVSRIPDARELLVEQFESREGHHLFFYPFAGRQAHTGLGALFAWRLGRLAPATFSFSVNDYGFELLSAVPFSMTRETLAALATRERLLEDVLASLNAAELAKRHFREIARVAGLVFQGFPGAPKSNRQVQATAGLIFDVFAQWDRGNPLLTQAQREVLERELEFVRLDEALAAIESMRITVKRTGRPSPFGFPLMVERFRDKLSSEKLADRIARMQLVFDRAA